MPIITFLELLLWLYVYIVLINRLPPRKVIWAWRRWDSNPGHLACERTVLSIAPRGQLSSAVALVYLSHGFARVNELLQLLKLKLYSADFGNCSQQLKVLLFPLLFFRICPLYVIRSSPIWNSYTNVTWRRRPISVIKEEFLFKWQDNILLVRWQKRRWQRTMEAMNGSLDDNV